MYHHFDKYLTRLNSQVPQPNIPGFFTWINRIPDLLKNKQIVQAAEILKPTKAFADKCSQTEETVLANKCEWFFKDSVGNWIKYGRTSSRRSGSYAAPVLSEQLEENFFLNPRDLLHIESQSQKYTIDFINMIQTNSFYKTKRNMLRKIDFSSLEYLPVYEKFNWYYLDENNHWILYGNTNGNIAESHTTQSSNYIESEFNKNPRQNLTICSKVNTYLIDFCAMTQKNVKSNVTRPVCRVQFSPNKQDFPPSWCGINATTVECVALNCKEDEFTAVCAPILKMVRNATIINVYRIQNPYLWKSFVSRKKYLKKQHPSIKYHEETLYHGTPKNNISSICKDSFDWRLHGSKVGNFYGRGTYFTNRCVLSIQNQF